MATAFRLAGALLLVGSVLLTGCGRVSAGAAPVPSTSPKQLAADIPLDTPMDNGLGGSNSYGALTGTGGATLGPVTNAGPSVLSVGSVEKKKSGFLWRKLTIKGAVTNKGAEATSGEIQIKFKKGGKVVQSEYVAIPNLAPGASQSYEAQSEVAADDVEVTATGK